MKHYKNTTEKILGTIQEQIHNQNEDTRCYGHRTNQTTISRTIKYESCTQKEIKNMMGIWKDYTIYSYGEEVDQVTARSKKEAVELYVEECIEGYKEVFGSEPTDDMIEDVYKNTKAVCLSD